MLFTIKNRQTGATLITALIMLIVLTLLVVSGIRSSSTNLRIAGNMQMQEEAIAAAQQAIENVISTTDFNAAPQIVGNFNVAIGRNCLSATPVLITAADFPPECEADAGTSICYQTTWEIAATAIDPNTGARAIISQGVSMMTNSARAETICPNVISF